MEGHMTKQTKLSTAEQEQYVIGGTHMKELYTAVGQFTRKKDGENAHPVITTAGNEYIPDIHELIIWTIMSWRIQNREQIERQYRTNMDNARLAPHEDLDFHFKRLLARGYIVKGSGETDADAIYDLFAELHIVPVTSKLTTKICSFLKLTLFKNVRFKVAANEIFRKATISDDERRVMDLVKQNIFSTTELMACIDKDSWDAYADINDQYSNEYAAVVSTAADFDCKIPILTAIANLYIRKQIIFQRINS
jgi:hypothetical protein